MPVLQPLAYTDSRLNTAHHTASILRRNVCSSSSSSSSSSCSSSTGNYHHQHRQPYNCAGVLQQRAQPFNLTRNKRINTTFPFPPPFLLLTVEQPWPPRWAMTHVPARRVLARRPHRVYSARLRSAVRVPGRRRSWTCLVCALNNKSLFWR